MAEKQPLGSFAKKLTDAMHERLERVATAYLRGTPISKIAKAEGVNPRTIKSDLARARELWRERTAQSYDVHLDLQLAKLDQIELAAWTGWERSIKDGLETGQIDSESKDGATSTTTIKRKKQTGNASFLKIIQDTVRQRSELLGLVDIDAKSVADGQSAEIVSIVIESREEAESFRTLSLVEYQERTKTGTAG